jgi:hypothetical protein
MRSNVEENPTPDESELEIPAPLEPYRERIEKMAEGLPAWKARDRILAMRASSYKLARTVYKTPTGEQVVELPKAGGSTRYMITRNGSWRKVKVFG